MSKNIVLPFFGDWHLIDSHMTIAYSANTVLQSPYDVGHNKSLVNIRITKINEPNSIIATNSVRNSEQFFTTVVFSHYQMMTGTHSFIDQRTIFICFF